MTTPAMTDRLTDWTVRALRSWYFVPACVAFYVVAVFIAFYLDRSLYIQCHSVDLPGPCGSGGFFALGFDPPSLAAYTPSAWWLAFSGIDSFGFLPSLVVPVMLVVWIIALFLNQPWRAHEVSNIHRQAAK